MFLDVDGTLLEFAHQPDAVQTGTSLPIILDQLVERLGGALALVSGRTVEDLDKIFFPRCFPAAGQHGFERRDASGTLHRADVAHALEDIRPQLKTFSDGHMGALLEDKGSALALHYRQAPGLKSEALELVQRLTADRDELHYLAGKMVYEIKSRMVNKGVAIACFMEESPFAGRLPIFIGDDVTDEDGFRFVNQEGGLSIRVGDACGSVAQFGVPNVQSVLGWLHDVAKNLDEGKQ